MTNTGADMHTITLEKGLATFLNTLSGKNRSGATIRAYQTDISQFIAFLHANNVSIQTPSEVEKIDVMEYLSHCAKRELTGIARARKLSALREYFRFLEGIGVITKSPTTGIETPKREKNGRQVLRPDEYTKMLSLAGAKPRDYAVLQVFLQTGIRVSELAHLTTDDIDFIKPAIKVRGKCKGLQSKWLRTAIIAFLGPDYLPLSISPGPDYLPLRLQSTAWDCNQRCWDHIICNSTPSPFSARPSGR
jgi:site-specific recombinase XerD